MMLQKCVRGVRSLLQVRTGPARPRFGPKILEDLQQSHFSHASTNSPFLEPTKSWPKSSPQVMHRGFTGESLVPSYRDKSKKSKKGVKPGKRIKVAEQGRVYGNLRLIDSQNTIKLQRKE